MSDQTGGSRGFDAVSDLLSFWRAELKRASADVGVPIPEEVEAYLAHMLDGYTRLDPATAHELGFGRPAALMFADAAELPAGERLEAYRRLGDACLYNCGFFAARLTRRSVSASYYEQMGRQAYERAGALGRRAGRGWEAIFRELSARFAGWVAALRRLSEGARDQITSIEALIARLAAGEPVSHAALARAGLLLGSPGRG